MKRIVVKVGTKVITDKKGVLDRNALGGVVKQLSQLKKDGYEVVLVSSGAMGAGKSMLKTNKRLTEISEKQLYAAIGQSYLINEYSNLFAKDKLLCAQVLATKEDFRDRLHFFNMRNCLETLLHDNVIPIINENDVVAVSELTFTDNDELAGLIASMLNADLLLILSSVDGIIDPEGNKVVPVIEAKDHDKYHDFINEDKSEAGRGGMITKFEVAKKAAKQGIEVFIANGTKSSTIISVVEGKKLGTHFVAGKKLTHAQRRLAHLHMSVKGKAYINECAVDIMLDESAHASLLPVGITKVEGDFEKGDIIEIVAESGKRIGYGVAQYDDKKAAGNIGKKNTKPLVHYDYMFIG